MFCNKMDIFYKYSGIVQRVVLETQKPKAYTNYLTTIIPKLFEYAPYSPIFAPCDFVLLHLEHFNTFGDLCRVVGLRASFKEATPDFSNMSL